MLANIKATDKYLNSIRDIVSIILSTKDAIYIDEICLSKGSFDVFGNIKDNAFLFVETSPLFENSDLYSILNDLEDKYEFICLSVEPNMAGRKTDVVSLYKKESTL